MKNPKVAILIPMYNAENYIIETIESALNQTHKNIEIIIVDDGSTDNSYKKVASLNNEKIHLVKNQKKGACSARNYAFELANSDYIQYLDADDLINQEKLENQLKILTKKEDSISYGLWARFINNINHEKITLQGIKKNYENPTNLLVDVWNNENMVTIHSWLTPSSIIKKAGKWNEELTHNQDGEFFSRVLISAKNILFCNYAISYYRSNVINSISNSSTSKTHAASQLLSYQLYVENLNAFKHNFEVKKALANNFINFIYRFHPKFPDLLTIAEDEFYNLEVGEMWPVGGKNFKILGAIFGFKNALKIRSKIRG